MASFIQFIIAAAVLTTVLGQNYNITSNTISNGTQDYVKIAQAELLYKINIAEMENNAVDVQFLNLLAVIELQQQQVLNEVHELNQTLTPMPVLGLPWKYCIQKYNSQFVTYQSAKDQFKACNNMSQKAGTNLTYNARLVTEKARGYALRTLPSDVNNCESYNYKDTPLENCAITYVAMATKTVEEYLDQAQSSREQIIFDMNSIALSAVQCTFNVEKVVLEGITLTSKKINNCLNGEGKQNVLSN